MSTTITGDFGTIRIEREIIGVRVLDNREPDPNWRYIDQRGHGHYREHGAYPTLRWVVDERYYCEDCLDWHEEGHWECAECGEHIKPGVRHAPERRSYPGLSSYFLNDEPISEEKARELVETAAREAR